MRSGAVSAVLAGVAALGSARAAMAQGGPPPALVRLDPVKLETVEQRREVMGEVRAVRRSAVAAEEAGLVIEMNVEVGQVVKQGATLAKLNDRLRALEVEQRRAMVNSKRAEVAEEQAKLEKAQRDLERVGELAAKFGASQNEVDDARTAVAEAEARLAGAQAEVVNAEAEEQWAERRVSYMEIKAPFTGAIVRKESEIGQWVAAGDVVVEMVSLDEVDVYLDVPERFLDALSQGGTEVELQLPALRESLTAHSFTVVAMGDRLARTFPVRVRLENPDGRLKPGMSVIGMTPTGAAIEAMTVHKDAVMRNDAGAFVWFDGGGVAQVASVDAMFAVGDRVAVRSTALKPGMSVLVEGNERVFPGQPLSPVGAGAKQAPASGDSGAAQEKGH